jgi:hypothetical protein
MRSPFYFHAKRAMVSHANEETESSVTPWPGLSGRRPTVVSVDDGRAATNVPRRRAPSASKSSLTSWSPTASAASSAERRRLSGRSLESVSAGRGLSACRACGRKKRASSPTWEGAAQGRATQEPTSHHSHDPNGGVGGAALNYPNRNAGLNGR